MRRAAGAMRARDWARGVHRPALSRRALPAARPVGGAPGTPRGRGRRRGAARLHLL